jgi:hypothetical protein
MLAAIFRISVVDLFFIVMIWDHIYVVLLKNAKQLEYLPVFPILVLH